MKKTAVILLSLLALAACNTIEGAGEDIQKAGSWTSQKANQVQKKM